MTRFWRLLKAATNDAQRAEQLMFDPAVRQALRTDPEAVLLGFELRARTVTLDEGIRTMRIESRDRGVRAARQRAALG